MQRWSKARRFPVRIVVEERKEALQRAKGWRGSDTVRTDGSRQETGEVGAACVWETPGGWTGCSYHLGNNKEVFDAEVFAIYRALSVIEQRQEWGRQYTIFVDSTSAITRVGDDSLGTGQRFAVAAIEVCNRIITNDNSVTIRWVPAHSGATGNDQYAKSAATGEESVEAIPEGYEVETSLSHMTRVATEDPRGRQSGSRRTYDPRDDTGPLRGEA